MIVPKFNNIDLELFYDNINSKYILIINNNKYVFNKIGKIKKVGKKL